MTYRLGGSKNVTVEVNNVLVNKEIHNVFGVIKGFTDPGRTFFLLESSTVDLFSRLHCASDMCLQIVTWSWGLRETPGVGVTPELLLAPPYCWNWPRLCAIWWRTVNNMLLCITTHTSSLGFSSNRLLCGVIYHINGNY